MAEKKKKHQIWLVNRIFLRAVWLMAKYSTAAIVWLSRKTASAFGKKVAPKIAAKVKKKAKKGTSRHEAAYSPFVPETTVEGSYDDFEKSLLSRSQIILIFGKRGSGKSALGFRIVENVHALTKRPCFVLGVSSKLLPEWISSIENLEDVSPNSVVLVDEGAISFSSRESMQKRNVTLGKMLATARHKDLTLVFVTQNTGMIDKSVLNLTDVVIGNEGSLLQKQMERPALKNFIEKVDAAFRQLEKGERIRHSYVFSDDFEGLCSVSLPGFWSERVSKNQA